MLQKNVTPCNETMSPQRDFLDGEPRCVSSRSLMGVHLCATRGQHGKHPQFPTVPAKASQRRESLGYTRAVSDGNAGHIREMPTYVQVDSPFLHLSGR
jgi:hypothetical protein